MYVSGRIADFDVPRPSFGRCYSTVYDRNDVRLFAWSMGPTVDDVPFVIREDSDLVQPSTIHTPMSCKAFIHIHRLVYRMWRRIMLNISLSSTNYFSFCVRWSSCDDGLGDSTIGPWISGTFRDKKNGLLIAPRFPYSDFYIFILVSLQYDSA